MFTIIRCQSQINNMINFVILLVSCMFLLANGYTKVTCTTVENTANCSSADVETPMGVIIGLIIGLLVAVMILVCLICRGYCCFCRCRRSLDAPVEDSPDDDIPVVVDATDTV